MANKVKGKVKERTEEWVYPDSLKLNLTAPTLLSTATVVLVVRLRQVVPPCGFHVGSEPTY